MNNQDINIDDNHTLFSNGLKIIAWITSIYSFSASELSFWKPISSFLVLDITDAALLFFDSIKFYFAILFNNIEIKNI